MLLFGVAPQVGAGREPRLEVEPLPLPDSAVQALRPRAGRRTASTKSVMTSESARCTRSFFSRGMTRSSIPIEIPLFVA